jgi:hypothetical protein
MRLRSLLPSIKIIMISKLICTWVVILARGIKPIETIGALGLVEFIVHF